MFEFAMSEEDTERKKQMVNLLTEIFQYLRKKHRDDMPITKIGLLEKSMADLLISLVTPENKDAIHHGVNQFLLYRLCDECFTIGDVEAAYPHLYGVLRHIVNRFPDADEEE